MGDNLHRRPDSSVFGALHFRVWLEQLNSISSKKIDDDDDDTVSDEPCEFVCAEANGIPPHT